MTQKPETNQQVIEDSSESLSMFDVDALRLDQNFAEHVLLKRAYLTIPVRKPGPQEFVRVHASDDMQLSTMLIEFKEDRESFLIARALWGQIVHEIKQVQLFVAMNRQDVLFLWPVNLPGADGRSNAWNESALRAAAEARESWVRVKANMSLGAYDVFVATGQLADPIWPNLSFPQILEIAFKDRFITSLDHPAIQRLNGAV